MDDNDTAAGGSGGCTSPRSRGSGRIFRRKHTLRAIFRSSALVLLLGGYALYHRVGTSAPHPSHGLAAGRREEGIDFPRLLADAGGGGVGGGAATNATEPEDEPCPALETYWPTDPKGFVALYAVGTLYMFLALAIVCDEFFVPALEEMCSEDHLNLSMDVAGATLMAAGGSAPELFTSFVGTFKQSDIGIGTIVGSAVFNVLFVIGMCSLLSKEVLTLTWWPLFRDSAYYAAGLIVLTLLVGVFSKEEVTWWEALVLFGMYFGYVALMYFNRRLYKRLTGKELVLPGEDMEEGEDREEKGKSDMTVGSGDGSETKTTPLLSDDALGPSSDHGPSPLSKKTVTRTNTPTDFRWPGTFRAGILTMLVHRESWKRKGGIGIVAEMEGDVDRVFEQVDINGDGTIDKEELGKLFQKLGHEISEQDLQEVFACLDLDSNGLIHKDEFSDWYVKSEEHILSKVKPIFDKFDTNKSGYIDHNEIGKLLKTLEPGVTETDIDLAIKAMWKEGCEDKITYEEFSEWYKEHIASDPNRGTAVAREDDEEDEGLCSALSPPTGQGFFAWLWYLVLLPLMTVLTLTIPDVRRPGLGKWCYASFLLSIIWIGAFSFLMVDWIEIIGDAIGIPSVVMGLTVLAAGTSVPDLFSSVIVARMGQGDMAVSSSIGSNIFDILVGLPLPWLAFTLIPSTPDVVVIGAKGIFVDIGILVGMLISIIVIVHCQGWKMTRTLGGLMFLLYFAFLAQAITLEYRRNPCFGS